ncbi:MarR family winged helix-turn-helix transcriptional regulator [Jatrophihabitans fulvus]
MPGRNPPPSPPVGVAFLLTQLGALAADAFAAAVAEHDLTPPLAGVLRFVRTSPGLSQLELARRLGIAPSRLVAHLDELESRGWVGRERSPQDRRVNVLVLTAAGEKAFATLARTAREHEERFTAGLSGSDRDRLRTLLTRLADAHGLTPGVHPGFRAHR